MYFNMVVYNFVLDDFMMLVGVFVVYNDVVMVMVVGKLLKVLVFEVVFYQKVGIGNGDMVGNLWLQEMLDLIFKVIWDNYIIMNLVEMKVVGYVIIYDQEYGLNLVMVKVNGKEFMFLVYLFLG